VVFGIVTCADMEEVIIGSLRTTKITLDPDEFIKEVFGKDTAGGFYGGGKATAGGFKIPIGFLSGGENEEYQERKWQVFSDQIKQKLFDKIGVHSQSTNPTKTLRIIPRRAEGGDK
jgi:nanoRNase/pAp phosphatase (c-di-AMP/oligoRNAs hydrolase)